MTFLVGPTDAGQVGPFNTDITSSEKSSPTSARPTTQLQVLTTDFI